MNKVVYVVTTDGADIYAAMTRVSMASVRYSNPELFITLACDAESASRIETAKSPLFREADETVVVDSPSGDASFVNRFVKTKLRRLVSGRILYLDSDTFVRQSIQEIFKIDADVAAARNHSTAELMEQIGPPDQRVLNEMGWSHHPDVYINGGVLFFNETSGAFAFCDCWHQRYLASRELTKRYRDQPSLNAALATVDCEFQLLEGAYNCQFTANPGVGYDGSVWHYYSALRPRLPTEFENLCATLRPDENVSRKHIEKMASFRHPYLTRDRYHDFSARRFAWRHRWQLSAERAWSAVHDGETSTARILAARLWKRRFWDVRNWKLLVYAYFPERAERVRQWLRSR